jgi:hypothetical protein
MPEFTCYSPPTPAPPLRWGARENYQLIPRLVLRKPRSPSESPANLIRHVDLDAQLFSPGPDQVGVFLEHAARDDEVEVLLFEQVVGLFSGGDGADGADEHGVAEGLLEAHGEGRLGDVSVRGDGFLLCSRGKGVAS